MTVELHLDQMSLADKLEVMETLWTDLSRKPGELPSPAWHWEVLQERRRLADSGQLKFQDWDIAFKEIKRELHEDQNS